ncbi:MAG TPA: TonB-dependent receptor [Tenuifilaceae bacterium]|nr:TonB-dependent receptor [Tenuifilaceae bacterium]
MKQKFSTLKRVSYFLLLMLFTTTVWAQEITVTGRVTSAADGEPLIGVTVVIKGTTIGTSTDFNGNYSIKTKSASILLFSYVGYESQEFSVDGKSVINVSLAEAFESLEEVVVIGYGQVKREDLTGSVSTISAKDFNKGNITTPMELLMGRTSGVQITTNSGAPGAGAIIRIRGGSSLSASNDPLVVIDGIPIDNEGINGIRNPLSTINPNDIESFTVLKDASATAIYGSRASNGVIIITTKKGRKGSEFSLSYNTNLTLNTIAKKPSVFTADEFRNLVETRVANGLTPASALNALGTESTNWIDKVFENAMSHEHNLSATGSYKILPYRVSLNYTNQNGILKTDNMNRIIGALSLTPSLLDDNLKLNVTMNGTKMTNHFADGGAIGNAVSFDPTKPVFDNVTGTNYGGYYTWVEASGFPNGLAPRNPVALLDMRSDESDAQKFLGNIQANYRLPFIPELTANLNLGYDYSKSEGSIFVPRNASWAYETVAGRDGGERIDYDQQKKNQLLDFYLNYTKELSNIFSKFDVMAGHSWQHFWKRDYSYNTNDFQSESTKIVNYDKAFPTELYLISFFGRFNYTLKDRYLFTFTLRNDGTSRFAPENRWGLFPSYALAWKINEESFLKDVKAISELKLRLGYGVTGQQDVGGHYLYLPNYVYSQPDAQYILGGVPITTARPGGYDRNIKWEETTTKNIGLDFGFANNRISGSVEYYLRETKDLLNRIPIPAGTNFTNYLFTNIGNLENKGIEVQLVGRPIVSKDLYWEVSLNVTHNENKITKLTAVDDPTFLGVETGGISGGVGNHIQLHSIGYPSSTFFVYEQIYDSEGLPIEGLYVDRDGDGAITEADRYWFKNPAPDVFFGFGSRLEYKKFDFSFVARVNLGNYVYNNVSSNSGVYSDLWHTTGFLRNLNNAYDFNFNSYQYFSNYYIENASFLKVDNISLGYNFDNIGIKKMNFRVSAIVQNAFVITKYRGLDPEIFGGIDNNIYPRPRTFIFGLTVNF